MTQTALAPFDNTLQTTYHWLNELMEEMGWHDRQRAYHALRAVLHALRDRLTVEEVAQLSAQLPMLIRGIYYEGWRPTGKPIRERKKEDFLAHIGAEFRDTPDIYPEQVAWGVFKVLARHVSSGEIQDVKHVLPEDLRSLWP
jgi:uncharacterized protein (DUF2267 family)